MAFGIAGKADAVNAVALEHPGLDQLQAGVVRACRLVAVAAEHQRAVQTRLADQAGDQVLEDRQALQVAGRDVGDRDEAGLADPHGHGHHPIERLARNGGDEHLPAGRHQLGRRVQALLVASRHFGRVVIEQIDQRCARVHSGRRHGRHRQMSSRFREMMKDSSLNQSAPCLRRTSRVAFR